MALPRLGILLSGRGSNFSAIHAAIVEGTLPATIALVLSNIPEAPGAERARELGLDVEILPHRGIRRSEHDQRVVRALKRYRVDWVCLAGYMRILGKDLIDAYPQRIVNIHPSLLPAFPGLRAQQQAWDYGVRVTGCTVHLVDSGLDTGPIVDQATVHCRPGESPDELSARILEQEHALYPRSLARLLGDEWEVEGRRVVFIEDSGKKLD